MGADKTKKHRWVSIPLSEATLVCADEDVREVLRILVFNKMIDKFEVDEETDAIRIWCHNRKIEIGLLCEAFLQHPDPGYYSGCLPKKVPRQKN